MKRQRYRDDNLRLGQSLFLNISGLCGVNGQILVDKLFNMEDEEFCEKAGIPFSLLMENKTKPELFKNT